MINDIIAPDAGEIAILDGMQPGARGGARRSATCPRSAACIRRCSVLDMIEFMGELRGLSAREAKTRARRSGSSGSASAQWAKNKVQDLSKGMQQKVQFATALIHEPALVILDEPWSGLDPINAEVLREVVEEIRAAGPHRAVLDARHGAGREGLRRGVHHRARQEGARRQARATSSARRRPRAWSRSASPTTRRKRARARPCSPTSALVAERAAAAPGRASPTARSSSPTASTPQQLLAALLDRDVGLRRFEVVVPTLHQIFVDKVGARRGGRRAPHGGVADA